MKTLLLTLLLLAAVAHAQSTAPRLFLPGHVSGIPSNNTQGANVMYCATVPAEYTMPNLTKMAVWAAGNAGLIVGVGIYPNDDNGSALATMSVTQSGPNLASATGLTPFTLTGGTLYRLCTCGSVGNVNGFMLGVQQATTCCELETTVQLVQAFHPSYVGTAMNACTLGVPPTTTGAITPDATTPGRNAQRIPIILVQQ